MKKRLLCIAAAVLMVLAAVFAFGCEKQFPSEQEVLKSHLDKYCRENGEKIIEKYKNYFSGAQCSACYVDDSALVIEFRFDEKISDLEFQQRFAPDTENIIAEFRPIAQEIADASEITYTGVVLMFLDSEGQRVQSIPIFRIRVINRHGHVRLNKTSGKRRIGQAVKAVCQILLFLLWKKNLKYIIIGYDMVLDRYQYLLYNTKCGTAKLFRTRSVT